LFSCKKKNDIIEIYLTKEKIESYDGVPLRTAIKDTTIIRQVLESYKEEIRINTVNNKPIYMGHFSAKFSDLEEKPFINDSEIVGFDFENSDIVLIGTEYDELSRELIKIYTKLQLKTVNAFVMSTKAAEITKLAINSYLASKISFANTLGNLILKSGLQEESSLIVKTMENDSRIGKGYFRYGFGYGGSNLPRDLNSLTNYLKNFDINTILLDSIKESNHKHHEFLKSYYTSQNPNKSVPFVFKNIGFKNGSGNLIDSQPYKLCIELLEEGYYINLINDSSSKNDLTKLSESYDGRLKVYKKGTSPEGFLINI
jgi:UDP-glucose 6-dehydrogenase